MRHDQCVIVWTPLKSSIFVAPPSTVDEFAKRLEADVGAQPSIVLRRSRNAPNGSGSNPQLGGLRGRCETRRGWPGVSSGVSKLRVATTIMLLTVARAVLPLSPVKAARTTFYMDSLTSDKSSADPRARWGLIKEVLHSDDRSKPGTSLDPLRLAQSFTSFPR